MMSFLSLILLCITTVGANEALYIIRPSRSPSCVDQCSKSDCTNNDITLSQFVNNFTSYLTNDTSLVFSPGNYNLESELVIEHIHSFSMSVWPTKAVIICGKNARFEFRNISTVSVSGLELVGCFENYVVSVGLFQLENSKFFGNGQAMVNGRVLIIEKSTASLDGVVFISAIEKLQTSTSAAPQEPSESCSTGTIETTDAVIGILLKGSNVGITQSRFEGNKVGLGAVIYDEFGSDIMVLNTTFFNNSATEYCNNYCCFAGGIVYVSKSLGSTVTLYHSKFEKNVGVAIFIHSHGDNVYTSTASIIHSEFVNNTIPGPRKLFNKVFIGSSLVYLDAVMITVRLNKFINNRASFALLYVPYYYATVGKFTNNLFSNNSAGYELFVSPACQPHLVVSLGSSRCIQCSENWRRDLIVIAIAAFVAGIALVVFMLALNMTVAVGTLNGIFFYVHIVAANTETYFLPFKTPNFITVFISWLNFDIGFDICFSVLSYYSVADHIYKALIQLVFPTYVILLVIIVIVASEYSSKVGKIIGKGNPVAVLATMILLSYAKFLNAVLASFSLLYWKPAYGSRNVDTTIIGNIKRVIEETSNTVRFKTLGYFLLIVSILILFLCVIYMTLVFSWQWILRYQDKIFFKWLKYQKLHHFLEPYHVPYNGEYRFWTGLLLFVRAFLFIIVLLNFSLDPHVNLISVIIVVGGLILLKGVIAKRVYKIWLLDVIETAIYFNLVVFSAVTWYNLDFGGNQVVAAYTSVIVMFILLLGVIVFHILRYTKLYKYSFVEKAFKWTSSKIIDKKPIQLPPNDAPEELDGYQLERATAGDQELPTITYSVVEISQPAQNP